MVGENSESNTQEVTETWLELSLCDFTGPSTFILITECSPFNGKEEYSRLTTCSKCVCVFIVPIVIQGKWLEFSVLAKWTSFVFLPLCIPHGIENSRAAMSNTVGSSHCG